MALLPLKFGEMLIALYVTDTSWFILSLAKGLICICQLSGKQQTEPVQNTANGSNLEIRCVFLAKLYKWEVLPLCCGSRFNLLSLSKWSLLSLIWIPWDTIWNNISNVENVHKNREWLILVKRCVTLTWCEIMFKYKCAIRKRPIWPTLSWDSHLLFLSINSFPKSYPPHNVCVCFCVKSFWKNNHNVAH